MSKAAKLRALLAKPGLIVAPGCYDCLGARAIEARDFSVAYVSGGSVSMALGYPDYGLMTMTELLDMAGRIAGTLDIPVISDVDTGFGNELNVARTIRDFEARGIAGVHIEDQDFPKRCGHLAGKSIIPIEEYTSKIRAAAASRRDPDFLIIARIDARAVTGFEDAISRGNAAADAGADMIFIEAPESVEEMAAIPQRIKVPCMLNNAIGGKTPTLPAPEVEKMGYKLLIVPGAQSVTVINAVGRELDHIRQAGLHSPELVGSVKMQGTFRAGGSDEWDRLRDQFVGGATAQSPWKEPVPN